MTDKKDDVFQVLRLTPPSSYEYNKYFDTIVGAFESSDLADTIEDKENIFYFNAATQDSVEHVVSVLNGLNIDFSMWSADVCNYDNEDATFTILKHVGLNNNHSEKVSSESNSEIKSEFTDEDDDEDYEEVINKLKLEDEQNREQVIKSRREAEQARLIAAKKAQEEEQARVAAEQARVAAEQADEQARQLAIATTEDGMMSYVSLLDIPTEEIESTILPNFEASDAAKALEHSIDTNLFDQDKERLLESVPMISLTEEELDFDNEDIDNLQDDTSLREYIDETSALRSQYSNDRSIIRNMDPELYRQAQDIIKNIASTKFPKRSASIEDIRTKMQDDSNAVETALAGFRSDYADAIRDAMIDAAIEAAHEYARLNRDSTVQACSTEILEKTRDMSESLVRNSFRIFEMISQIDYVLDETSDITEEQKQACRAVISVIEYRAMSDRAMARRTNALAKNRLESEQVNVDEEQIEPDYYDSYENDSTIDEEPEQEPEPEPEPEHDDRDESFAALYNTGSSADETIASAPAPVMSDKPFDTLDSLDEPDFNKNNSDDEEDDLNSLDEIDDNDNDNDDIDEVTIDDGDTKPKKKGKRLKGSKFSKKTKIIAGVIGGILVLSVGGLAVFNLLPTGVTTTETTNDPHNLYKVGDSYTVNIPSKDGGAKETDVTIEKFVDSSDDSKDMIIVQDADNTEYKVSYGKMQTWANSQAANSQSADSQAASTSQNESTQNASAQQ